MKRFFRLPPSRATVRNDMEHELAFHMQGRIDDLMSLGLTREEAEAEAQKRFGNRAAVEAELEQMDRAAYSRKAFAEYVRDIMRDSRLAMRGLARRRAFTFTVVATLALGIGANTAIFSVADALLFRPPPYPHPEQLVSVWGASAGEYFSLRELTHSFSSIALYSEWAMNVGDDATTARADGADVSENLFSTLGVRPARGRTFSANANALGAAREVILSDQLWRTQFAADTTLVGKSILIEGVPRIVVGIMPSDFHFPALGTMLWFNSTLSASRLGDYWGWAKFKFVGRVRADVSLAQAQQDVRAAAVRIRKLNPVWDPGPKYGIDASITPLQTQLAGPARKTMLVLLGVVFTLLLITCANVANLVLVRSMEREREFAVRTALGCSRLRLARQLLTENLMLSVMGGIAALALAWGGVALISSALPPQIPRTAHIGVDGRVLAFTAVLALLAGIAFGIGPSFKAARSVRARGLTEMRGASRGAEHRRLADALTIVQLALAVMLVAGSGLLLRSFNAFRNADPGFSSNRVVVARVTLSAGAYREPARRNAFFDALLDRVAKMPGITVSAAVDRPPLRGGLYGTAVRIAGQFEDVTKSLPMIDHLQSVSPEYFATMGIPMLRGRAFTVADRDSSEPVAIISASVAKKFWPNSDPIGQHISGPNAGPWMSIVGVAAEVQQDSLNGLSAATFYRPLSQRSSTDVTIVVKSAGTVADFETKLKEAVASLDRTTPVTDVRALESLVEASFARARFTAMLLAGFAALALLISGVGIYGVVSATVAQRTREMGVRMALGATPAQVLGHVMSHGTYLAVAGVLVGLVGGLLTSRLLTGLLFGVTSTDGLTFALAPTLLMLVGLVATWIPARRMVRHSPVAALRTE